MNDELEKRSAELREMVEGHWRNLIRLAGISPQMAGEEVFRFEAMTEQMAAGYAQQQATSFRNALSALRGEYAERERNDPEALRKALNITGGGSGLATAWLANLETPASIDLKEQQDDFWRDLLANGISNQREFEARWARFVADLQAQVAHLPQPEQDGIMTRVVLRNAEYIALAQQDRAALKARL